VKLLSFDNLQMLCLIGAASVFDRLGFPGLKGPIVSGATFAVWLMMRRRRRQSEENLSTAFDQQLSQCTKRQIVGDSFHEHVQEMLWFTPSAAERSVLRTTELHGLEHLQSALRDGRGVILWESNGFGRRDMLKRILYEKGFPVHQVHAENHLIDRGGLGDSPTWLGHSVIRPYFNAYEQHFVADIVDVPRSSSLAFTRALSSLLQENRILCAAGDAHYGRKLIPLNFLGQIDLFSPGMVSLAKLSGAPLLPTFCVYDRESGVHVAIEPPIRIDSAADREEGLADGVAQYLSLLESYIKKYPGKYRLWHAVGQSYRDENQAAEPILDSATPNKGS
jgi:lauroyl/myristoyl acyltransferase